MRLLTSGFVEQWQGRLLNIHPGAAAGLQGSRHPQARAGRQAKLHGATVHFVVPEMDSGPIIVQGAVPVRRTTPRTTLAERVLAVEHRIYPQALKLVAEGRVRIVDGRCLIDGAPVALSASEAPGACLPRRGVNNPAVTALLIGAHTACERPVQAGATCRIDQQRAEASVSGLAEFHASVSDLRYPMIRIAFGYAAMFLEPSARSASLGLFADLLLPRLPSRWP